MQHHAAQTRHLTVICLAYLIQHSFILVESQCNLAAARARPDFYGHCPCSCQNIAQLSCTECPVTCRRYFEKCPPAAACLTPPPVTAGVVWRPICHKVAAGAKCYGDCMTGYVGTGATSKCTTAGWTTPISRCTPITVPAAAAAVPAAEITEAVIVSSVKPVASPVSAAVPAAAAVISCPGLARKPNNTVGWPESCRNAAVGALCSAACIAGYTGRAVTQCQVNGKWQTAKNTCRQISSARQQQSGEPLTAAAAAAAAAGDGVQDQAAAAAAAATAMAAAVVDQSSPAVAASPELVTCAGLPALVPNTLAWPESCLNSSMGSRCMAECQTGYHGRAIAICLATGSWSAAINLCKKVCGGNPSDAPGVQWQACDGTPQRQSCSAPCPFGFTGTGYTAVCGVDGVWGQPAMQCSEVFCQGSPPVTGGVAWPDCTGHRVGESCVADRCAEGFEGTGAIVNCMPDGTWYDLWTDCSAT